MSGSTCRRIGSTFTFCRKAQAFVVARDGKGLAELVERMGTLGPERIAVEATGGFETVVAAALAGASLPVVVVNPAQVRHFAQALGRRAKTDPIDASMIARFVEATKPDLRDTRPTRPRNCSPTSSRGAARSSK